MTVKEKIKLPEKLGFMAFSTSSNIVFNFKSLYYLTFLKMILKIPVFWASTILTIGTIWDAVNDPLIGFWSVNNKFKSGEYEVFNSHHHFDHIGDDWRFEKIYAYNHPVMIKALSEPLPDEYIKPQFEADQFAGDAPIKTHVYEYKPVSFRLIEEGYVFSLGDRSFRVMHTPGHAEDAVMLVNDKEKLLFTGDTYYPAPLYCFENTFDVYTGTMKKLAENYADYLLITSHNEPLRQGNIFKDIYEGFTKIMNHEIKPDEYPGEREFYVFKEFSLIKKKEGKEK